MTLTALLMTALIFVALTGPAQAANMYAGPLFPTGNDRCECEIANITTSAKTVQVVVIDDNGVVIGSEGPVSVPGGHVFVQSGSGFSTPQYCKFVNASPTFFRASIACFGTPDASDNVALPAQ